MSYYELKLDDTLVFNSLHSIDYLGWKPRLKLLSDFDLIIVKDSTLELLHNSEKCVLNPGEALLALPGETTYITPRTDAKTGVFVLHFSSDHFLTKQKCEARDDSSHLIFLTKKMRMNNDHVYVIAGIMFEELKYKRFGYRRKLNLCLAEILYELHRCCAEDVISGRVQYNYSTVNIYTRKIIDYVHNNYDKSVKSADIEKLLNLNYDYVNSIFKNMTGFTIMNYVDRIRISRAKQLIDTTALKLGEIASVIGMDDPHYFSKKFKKIEGISPSELKKQVNSKQI